MPTPQRPPEPDVIARLLAQPQRFSFAQAVNIVLLALRRQGVPYERAFRDIIRFRNNLSLSFPASEVHALEIESKGAPSAGDIDDAAKIRITPAFIGLLGACGTLPLHDSERLTAQQQLDRDASQHELIDVFSNRMIGLFFEADAKYRVEQSMQVRGQDRLLPMLMALAGAQPAGASQAAAYYAGILRTRPVSASAIERVLADHFAIPVRVEQLVGCWDEIAPNRRSTFGMHPIRLGAGAVLGTRLWRHDLRARLHIGPLDEAQLTHFLPDGASRAALADMMALFAVPVIAWEVRLLLAPPCIQRLTLTADQAPRKLGWSSFLTANPGKAQRTHIASMLKLPKRN
jgi:type VI secretion system protein ImpH